MRLAFRTDASLILGTGHVMRSLTLADRLRAEGATIRFLCRDEPGHMIATIEDRGYAVERLPANISAAEDATRSAALFAGWDADWLIVDHYALDHEWERVVRPLVGKILVLDDLADRRHDCDLLSDATPRSDGAALYGPLVPPGTPLCLGPRYALLRPEFAARRHDVKPHTGRVRRILVALGGVDPENYTADALAAIRAVFRAEVAVDVVLGPNAPHLAEVAALVAAEPAWRLHVDTPAMAELMAAADLAVGAGGTTSWERLALGLPALLVALAPNQETVVRTLTEAGAVIDVAPRPAFAASLQTSLEFLRTRPAWLQRMAARGAALVDGRGAERLARMLLPPPLRLRHATAADMRAVWTWRNDPLVRAASLDPAPIPWERHTAWFTRVLATPTTDLLIAEDNQGAPVAVLRLDQRGVSAEISLYLTPGHHGLGLGPWVLRAGEDWLRRQRPEVTRLEAVIRPENRASHAAFAAAGYAPVHATYQKEVRP